MYTRKNNGNGKQVGLQPPVRGVAGHEAHSQGRRQHANAEEIGHWQMGFGL